MTINEKNANLLGLKYTFDLIPDSPAATKAGYTKEDRDNSQTWYSPIVDGKYFYYTAWNGSILSPTHKSSILVCRKISDGQLIYAVDCSEYNLDTAPNFLGDSTTITRCRPFILKDRLYLVNAVMSNIGPQLYSIDKKTGELIWACAYYTPEGAPNMITTKGNYSQFTGSNMRISDLNLNGDIIDGKPHIFLGTSSFQNAVNVGTINGNFPKYTDQGFLYCIIDNGSEPMIKWKTPTCAPILNVNDTIVKGGNPDFDPFRPDSDIVIIQSVSSPANYFVQPHFLPAPPSPAMPNTTPFASIISFTKDTIIDANIAQTIWGSINIYQDTNRADTFTLAQLVDLWNLEQSVMSPTQTIRHTIWNYVNPDIVELAKTQPGNNNILYFKYMTSGQKITNEFDAQSLNYWGNSTWGEKVHVDTKSNLVYFSTGQGHEIPIDEIIYYSQPQFNFLFKNSLVDAIVNYKNNPTEENLKIVNAEKNSYISKISTSSLNVLDKSPRGRMSYSDGVLGSFIKDNHKCHGKTNGNIAFATRVVPIDTYSFLNQGGNLIYPFNVYDGDVSSGIKLFEKNNKKRIATASKSGISIVLDLSNYNPEINFNNNNFKKTGVTVSGLIFSGPNGALGGSNYSNSSNKDVLFSCQGNMAWFDGSKSTNGQFFEEQVDKNGKIIQINNSFLDAFNVFDNKVIFQVPYDNRAHAQVLYHNNMVFTEDDTGSLYSFDSETGKIIWKYNAAKNGMNGGVVTPVITNDNVIWINNYAAFGIIGSPGKNGCVFEIKKSLRLPNKLSTLFNNSEYVSWDTFPKLNVPTVPAIKPVNNVIIVHNWSTVNLNTYLSVKHTYLVPASEITAEFFPSEYDPAKQKIKFLPVTGQLIYKSLRLINKNTYLLKYLYLDPNTNTYTKNKAWLEKTEVLNNNVIDIA